MFDIDSFRVYNLEFISDECFHIAIEFVSEYVICSYLLKKLSQMRKKAQKVICTG